MQCEVWSFKCDLWSNASLSHKARTSELRWRTAHARPIDKKGLIVLTRRQLPPHQKGLRTNASTQGHLYTPELARAARVTLLHTHTHTHKRFYTQKLLHADAFPHVLADRRILFTELRTMLFRVAVPDTQTCLQTGAFTHRCLYQEAFEGIVP